MISDGGHFENLAAYELVRRRCGTIIISDGECDPKLTFEGLGTLIRMCEVDFGVTIDIDVERIRRGRRVPTGAPKRCAVGRIDVSLTRPTAMLIYLKASMTGQRGHAGAAVQVEPSRRSRTRAPATSSTREDQFESYRRLGRAVAQAAYELATRGTDVSTGESRS